MKTIMLRIFLVVSACFLSASLAFGAVQEYPLFSKLATFTFTPKESRDLPFGAHKFKTGINGKDSLTVEGKYITLRYKLEKNADTPGQLYIIRNFMNAVQQVGGEVLFENRGSATFRIIQGEKEIWAEVSAPSNGKWYDLDIVEKKSMQQEVTVNPVLDAIDRAGKATVYINFDTASSKIRPDSEPVIETIYAMLQERPEMKISIEGHTDGDGTAEGNQKLSEERARAVQTALVGRGIIAARLISKGHGMSMPVADNTTEDGKAKNRRVELVKM